MSIQRPGAFEAWAVARNEEYNRLQEQEKTMRAEIEQVEVDLIAKKKAYYALCARMSELEY